MCGLHGSFLWANFTWAGYLFRVFQGMPYMSRVSFWCWLKNLGWQLPFSGWNAIFSHKLCLYHHHNVTKTVIMIQYFLSLTWAGYVFCIIRSRPYISGSSFPDPGRTSRLLAYLVNPPRCMFTAAAAAAAMWVLNKHESDARLSQREIERYEITHEPFLWLIWILVTLCSKSNSWFQWDQSINA